MHQPWRPLHGAKSSYTWPSIDTVPPPAGALPHAEVGGGGGGGGRVGGGSGGGGPPPASGAGDTFVVSPRGGSPRHAGRAPSGPPPRVSAAPDARSVPRVC